MSKFDRRFGIALVVLAYVCAIGMVFVGQFGASPCLAMLGAIQFWFYRDSVASWRKLQQIKDDNAQIDARIDTYMAELEAIRSERNTQ